MVIVRWSSQKIAVRYWFISRQVNGNKQTQLYNGRLPVSEFGRFSFRRANAARQWSIRPSPGQSTTLIATTGLNAAQTTATSHNRVRSTLYKWFDIVTDSTFACDWTIFNFGDAMGSNGPYWYYFKFTINPRFSWWPAKSYEHGPCTVADNQSPLFCGRGYSYSGHDRNTSEGSEMM